MSILRCLCAVGLASALLACHPASPAGGLPAPQRVERVIRNAVAPDRAAAARHEGALRVLVRRADAPERTEESVRVLLRRPELGVADSLVQLTDSAGVAVFAVLAAGDYIADIRRLGFQPLTGVPIRIEPGCGTVVEVYLGLQALCLGRCPPTPGRAVISACRGDA